MLRNLAYRIPLILLPLLLVTSQIKRCNSKTMEHRLVNTSQGAIPVMVRQ